MVAARPVGIGGEKGFTLVELLVAFSILLVGMTGIISLFSAGLALERDGTLSGDTAQALTEIQPLVKQRLMELIAKGENGELHLGREPIPGRIGLDYSVDALPIPDLADSMLVRILILPRGSGEEAAREGGYLPMRLGPTFEERVRQSPQTLPSEGTGRGR